MDSNSYYLNSEAIAQMEEIKTQHPLNPDSELFIRPLADIIGLTKTKIHLATLKPGKESNLYHSHHYEEEFYYILHGHGTARIDNKEYSLSSGDFMAFPAPSVPHGIRNTSNEDLIYLVGGERKEFEIVELPDLDQLVIRDGRKAYVVDRSALKQLKAVNEEEST